VHGATVLSIVSVGSMIRNNVFVHVVQ